MDTPLTDHPGGELERLIRSLDWSRSPLGPRSSWPECLDAAVDLILPAQAQIVIFAGPEFVAIYNDAYAPTIGDKHPHALGRPAREYWSELWSDLEPLLQHVRTTGETISAKDRRFYIERHGFPEYVYFDISYSPVRDHAGVVQAVLCIVSETTARVAAQHALQESEARLRALFRQATGGIALIDLDGRFAMVNDRFCEITGRTEAELLRLRMQDITFRDDLPATVAQFDKLLQRGESVSIEKRLVRKDGSLVWISNSLGAVRDEAGSIRQASAIILDISDRRRTEALERRLAAIIASSDDAILGTDLDMRVTSWNNGAAHLYGYSAEEVLGLPVTFLVPADRPDEETAIIARIREGERVEPHETKRRHKDGRLIDVSLTVSPIRDEHGRIVGASKIARDITERKAAERLQHVLMGELQHRVKNVLATVQAIARQTFGRAEGGATDTFFARLTSLAHAHDLLTRENWNGAELSAVVADIIAPYRPEQFEAAGPSLRLPPRSVLTVSLAMHELATNAAKYGALSVPQGRVEVRWALRPDDPSHFELHWRESGGPAVTPPLHKGFGTRLIQQALAAELRGEVQVIYEADGVVCRVHAPVVSDWERGE
ncbi:MAG: PAS domain S-box protein [Rhizobiales bacterium]|nr:PAS domain S-box protein [Hyphomicrobiales bacterium]